MIKELAYSDLPRCVEVLHESFATVSAEFGLTEQNCPTNAAFVKIERLQKQLDGGYRMFGLFDGETMVGFVSLSKNEDGSFNLNNLAVLPRSRHRGYGKELIDFCKVKVRELGGLKIKLGIIEKNERLKAWYLSNGFVHTGTMEFKHLPFTVGYMEADL